MSPVLTDQTKGPMNVCAEQFGLAVEELMWGLRVSLPGCAVTASYEAQNVIAFGKTAAEHWFGHQRLEETLTRELASATTIADCIEVFNSAPSALDGIGCRAWIKMIEVVQNVTDAEKVFLMAPENSLFRQQAFTKWVDVCATSGDVDHVRTVAAIQHGSEKHRYVLQRLFSLWMKERTLQGNP